VLIFGQMYLLLFGNLTMMLTSPLHESGVAPRTPASSKTTNLHVQRLGLQT
jgi:hypothetical protein